MAVCALHSLRRLAIFQRHAAELATSPPTIGFGACTPVLASPACMLCKALQFRTLLRFLLVMEGLGAGTPAGSLQTAPAAAWQLMPGPAAPS